MAGRFVQRQLQRMFQYRHETTASDLALHRRTPMSDSMKIAISGASGLVGSALIPLLTTGGHTSSDLYEEGQTCLPMRSAGTQPKDIWIRATSKASTPSSTLAVRTSRPEDGPKTSENEFGTAESTRHGSLPKHSLACHIPPRSFSAHRQQDSTAIVEKNSSPKKRGPERIFSQTSASCGSKQQGRPAMREFASPTSALASSSHHVEEH